ncbi:hypothetical protein [Luteolibacter soli]|uniref:Uncharacterized protein n=1 Tax=Luteolibacter soli TaxID=3135280 RepID=A0ABU9B0D0_9BACT
MKDHKEGDSSNRNAPATSAKNVADARGLTGIPTVDEILAPIRDQGGVVLLGGYHHEAKSILASQIAGRLIHQSLRVSYLSMGEEESFILRRIISSTVPWPMEVIGYCNATPSGEIWDLRMDFLAVEGNGKVPSWD